MSNSVWIVDFGSQYTQLITRSIRELGLHSEVITVSESLTRIKNNEIPSTLILSGGPNSIYEDNTDYSPYFKNESLPILGICYGMQLMAQFNGGTVTKNRQGEYGHAQVSFCDTTLPFKLMSVWMSHADHVSKIPTEFIKTCESGDHITAGMRHEKKPWWGIQFHPEVAHTPQGKDLLGHFLFSVAKMQANWNEDSILDHALCELKRFDKNAKILCAFSGGVDSLVAATLTARYFLNPPFCFFVDTGLVRPQDIIHIKLLQESLGLSIETIDAKEAFIKALKDEEDPEKKRKIIGKLFIEIFEKEVKNFQEKKGVKFDYLLQGTLYPDVIESLSPHKAGGKSTTIKSHHNVGGLPEKMNLKLLEPLRSLFKDEVRELGRALKLPAAWLNRHPFPGPGIGVRILGKISKESIIKVQESDQILFEELVKENQYDKVWQAFTVLLPIKTVGVKGDGRSYEEVICIRIVDSTDGMTATWSRLPEQFLRKVSGRITNEVAGVTRVVYDITSKPPGTIEWE